MLPPARGCPTGQARLTPGFALRAAYVIHAVGPIWHGVGSNEEDLLAGCYRHALQVARDAGLESIAFPCISTGIYGYPPDEAARVAVRAVARFLGGNTLPRRVVFCAFDAADEGRLQAALGELGRGES